MKKVYIIATARTPIGSFNGVLSTIKATQLGAESITALIKKAGIEASIVEEVYMGNVLSAAIGQAPARQAAMFANLSTGVCCTTINKVCASGMKAISIGVQSILLGNSDVVIAGGMEICSQVPHYLPNYRMGNKLGNVTLLDGLIYDGLTDVYNQFHMGNAAELAAKKYNIGREEQDRYAINSYKKAADAWRENAFVDEIIPIKVPQKRGESIIIDRDEEFTNINIDKIPQLNPVFDKSGTITAANASTINDGAAAVLLMSEEKVKELGLKPLAAVVAYADAEQNPEWFSTTPALAINKLLKKAKLNISEISRFEINEAFSVVALANMQLLELNPDQVNVYGGAVSLGHPLGCSGARIVTTLASILKNQNQQYGIASICNGGGGASAILIENLN